MSRCQRVRQPGQDSGLRPLFLEGNDVGAIGHPGGDGGTGRSDSGSVAGQMIDWQLGPCGFCDCWRATRRDGEVLVGSLREVLEGILSIEFFEATAREFRRASRMAAGLPERSDDELEVAEQAWWDGQRDRERQKDRRM